MYDILSKAFLIFLKRTCCSCCFRLPMTILCSCSCTCFPLQTPWPENWCWSAAVSPLLGWRKIGAGSETCKIIIFADFVLEFLEDIVPCVSALSSGGAAAASAVAGLLLLLLPGPAVAAAAGVVGRKAVTVAVRGLSVVAVAVRGLLLLSVAVSAASVGRLPVVVAVAVVVLRSRGAVVALAGSRSDLGEFKFKYFSFFIILKCANLPVAPSPPRTGR